MRCVRVVLPLVVGILVAGQGVTTAATRIGGTTTTASVSGETTRFETTVRIADGEGGPGGDGEDKGHDGKPKGEDDHDSADESTATLGDRGAPADPATSPGGNNTTAPPPTAAPVPAVQELTRSVATSRTTNVLSRRFGRAYTHGNHKHVSCRRQSANSYVCSLSWRYHRQRYDGKAVVTSSGRVRTHVVSRRR